MSSPAIMFDWCQPTNYQAAGLMASTVVQDLMYLSNKHLVVLVLKGGGNWYGAVSAPLIKAQWANDPHHGRSTSFSADNLMFFIYQILPQYCCFMQLPPPAFYRCLLIFQQGGRILHIKFKPDLGPLFPFILWQTLCSTDLPPLPVQVPKTVIQNENNPYPTSITLNPSADESFKHLTRAAHYVLFQTNFCFWQFMESIKIARSVAGKKIFLTKIIHYCV